MSMKLSQKRAFSIREKVDKFYTSKVTAFGHGAKIGCEKDFLNRDVVVLILKKGESL